MSAHSFDDVGQGAGRGEAVPRASRTNLYLAATLVGDRSRVAVTVRNLSASGALIRAPVPIEQAGPVRLLRGSLSVDGTLAWTKGRNGGMRFDAPIDLATWAPGATKGQRDVDLLVALGRGQVAPLSRPYIAEAPAEERRTNLIARIAEEIAFAARRLEALGSRLADDPAVVARHAAQMQDLDVTTEVLGHLARLLASEAPEERVVAIGMADLRRRLDRIAV